MIVIKIVCQIKRTIKTTQSNSTQVAHQVDQVELSNLSSIGIGSKTHYVEDDDDDNNGSIRKKAQI